jgi:hypothetical protein
MPHAVVGVVLVLHGLITTMIGFGSVTNPNGAAIPVPSWFGWWPGTFGRSWLLDAFNDRTRTAVDRSQQEAAG